MRGFLTNYIVDVKNALLRRRPAGRAVTVFPDDTFLVSYPRVGSNWVRFLICYLTNPEQTLTLPAAEARIPGVYINSDRALKALPRPRIIKSHEPFDARYPRVIYIVRDPRDVAVSRYYFTLKWRGFPDGYPFEDFVKDRFLVARNAILNTGPWADHVIGWLTSRAGQDSFLLVRYEDLKADTAKELHRIARLLGVKADAERITRAIEMSSLQKMRSLDKSEPLKWLKGSRDDVPFIREGRSGGWRSVLPEQAVAAIESAWWPIMKLLGYGLSTPFPNGLPNPSVNATICEALSRYFHYEAGASGADRASLTAPVVNGGA